jgi:AraC-like DNA-binding protein
LTTSHVSAPLRHQLGGYREYEPPAALAPVAEAAWSFRTTQGVSHRVLPDPAVSIAFWCRREEDGRPIAPRLTLIGAKTRPHLVEFERDCEITALRIKLEWTRLILGLTPSDHEDGEHDLTTMLPRGGAALFDALVETRAPMQVARLIDTFVLQQLGRAKVQDGETAGRALDLVRGTAGRLPIERIAGRMGLSVRHLRRQVRRHAGVSLKGYARTLRIVHAMTQADRSMHPRWARLAADAGFCDQSHLIRECRALCRLSPVEVHRERRVEAEISNHG